MVFDGETGHPAGSTPAMPSVGDLVAGEYRIEALIGSGGMGAVYRATEIYLQRPVALKVIKQEHADSPEYREAFLRECRLAAKVDHPNVVRVHRGGEENGRLYLAMQYVMGANLGRVIEFAGPLAPQVAMRYLRDVATALDKIHSYGLVHADVKPTNVLIDEGRAVLTDFGIARESRVSSTVLSLSTDETWMASALGEGEVGTSAYMAPEQWGSAPVDGRVDIYALGALLYVMLTGRPPYARDDLASMRDAHLHADPPEPSAAVVGLPKGFDAVVRKALAKRPEHRYQSGEELSAAVESVLGTDLTPSRPASWRGQRASGWNAFTGVRAAAPGARRKIALRTITVVSVLGALVVGAAYAATTVNLGSGDSPTPGQGAPPRATSSSVPPTTASLPLGVLFQNDFSGTNSTFTLSDGASVSAQRLDGQFRLSVKNPDIQYMSQSTWPPIHGNVRIDAEVDTPGEDPAGFGLSCRLNTRGGLSHYLGAIGTEGYWRIVRYDGSGRPGTVLASRGANTSSPAMADGPVRMRFECSGPDVAGAAVLLKLYVNGQLTGTATDPAELDVGTVGLSANSYSGPADVLFDNVVVSRF